MAICGSINVIIFPSVFQTRFFGEIGHLGKRDSRLELEVDLSYLC